MLRAKHPGPVSGYVAPGFERVRVEFERNLAERGELGGAVAAYWHGEKVVDLWGGCCGPDTDEPWHEDTMVSVASTTKGLAAMTVAIANARGWLDYDAPIARYWPEFAQHDKGTITVRQLLAHEAGLVFLDEPLTVERMRNLDEIAELLARQKPAWPPGSRHGYHAMTIGLYMQELIRRVDPQHRTLGRFFHEEIAAPLGLDFYIGLPQDMPASRLAVIKPMSRWRALAALRHTPPLLIAKIVAPNSLLRRSLIFTTLDPNDRGYLEIEVPAGNGVGTARAIARAYSAFAEGGSELGITSATFEQLTGPPPPATKDAIIGSTTCFALGYMRPSAAYRFGSSSRAFGTPGAGGSFGFADPDEHLGYAYVTNKLDFYLVDDPREKTLRDAIYRAIHAAAARAA
jgi:CubicO group peptidase (beta-lactamase class C family)